MVRSGLVSRRARAGSPTIILPSSSTLTTEGQSVEPYGPGIHFGAPVCGSRYAIRLKVVPRSMPTTRPIFPLSKNSWRKLPRRLLLQRATYLSVGQLFLHAGYQVADVASAV